MFKFCGSRLVTAFVGLLVAMASNAAPVLFTGAGQSSTVSYSGLVGSTAVSGTVQYTLVTMGSNTATFQVVVSNTSASAGSLFGGFGITDVSPNITAVTDGSAAFDVSSGSTNFNGGGSMEFCARAVGNPCNNNTNSGLAGGSSTSFNVNFTFAASVPPISFGEGFYARFSTGSGSNNAVLTGSASVVTSSTPSNVPEPGSLALAGLALVGLAAARRFQRA